MNFTSKTKNKKTSNNATTLHPFSLSFFVSSTIYFPFVHRLNPLYSTWLTMMFSKYYASINSNKYMENSLL